MVKATDCKCCKCGKPAVAFWPMCDPDIQELPWCRECLDKAKDEVMMELFKIFRIDKEVGEGLFNLVCAKNGGEVSVSEGRSGEKSHKRTNGIGGRQPETTKSEQIDESRDRDCKVGGADGPANRAGSNPAPATVFTHQGIWICEDCGKPSVVRPDLLCECGSPGESGSPIGSGEVDDPPRGSAPDVGEFPTAAATGAKKGSEQK